jgi:hypothetical protein
MPSEHVQDLTAHAVAFANHVPGYFAKATRGMYREAILEGVCFSHLLASHRANNICKLI